MIDKANDGDFDGKVHGTSGTVIVEFSAKWCGPCVRQAQVLERFIETHPDVTVFEVDVEDAPRAVATYGVRAMPTLLVFRDGALERTAVGLQSDARVAKLCVRA